MRPIARITPAIAKPKGQIVGRDDDLFLGDPARRVRHGRATLLVTIPRKQNVAAATSSSTVPAGS